MARAVSFSSPMACVWKGTKLPRSALLPDSARIGAAVCLHARLAPKILTVREGAKEPVIQIVSLTATRFFLDSSFPPLIASPRLLAVADG
jgi:hypothetical protein